MKRLNLLLLSLLAVPTMVGCNNKKEYVRPLVDNTVYDVAIPNRASPVTSVNIINVPKTSIEIGYMSYMGIKMEIHYEDEVVMTIPFTEKLFPLDQLEMLKTPGKKYIDFLFKGNHISFDLTLVKASVPVYHSVKFRNHNNTVLQEKVFEYLEPAIYSGRTIESYEDNDYYYEFADEWDYNTDYVYCDFVTNAVYKATDIRNLGRKYTTRINLEHESGTTYAYNVFPIIAENKETLYTPKYLHYMGEVRNVEIAHSEAVYHKQNDFDVVAGDFSSKEALDFHTPMVNMVNDVYRLGDRDATDKFPYACITKGYNLALDMSVEDGKAKGLGDGRFKQMGYSGNLNYKRSDGRIISYESILNDEIKDDVFNMMKDEVSTSLYAGKYKTGYYRMSYVATIDLILEVTYDVIPSTGVRMVEEAKLYPCFAYDKLKAILSYSESGSFEEIHQQTINFDIDDLRAILPQ